MIPNKMPSTVSPGNITPNKITPNAKSGGSSGTSGVTASDDSFKKLLDQTTNSEPVKTQAPLQPNQALQNAKVPDEARSSVEQLKFSGHAVERMKSRGISFAPEELK